MSHHDNELENQKKAAKLDKAAVTEKNNEHQASRRRLLTMIGVGLAGAYVAPTLFSLGQAQAGDWRNSYSRPSYSRPSYSRPSYSRPSGYEYHRRRDQAHERVREYTEDPIRILEDAIFGTQNR